VSYSVFPPPNEYFLAFFNKKKEDTINLFFDFKKKIALSKRMGKKEYTIKERMKLKSFYFFIQEKNCAHPRQPLDTTGD